MGNGGSNPVRQLLTQGQSVWLDYISRDLVRGGGLRRFIEDVGLRGETSNPSIFEKAIGSGSAYDAELRELAQQGNDANKIFDRVAISDVREACDVFRPLYESSGGADGFVSIEVGPAHAYDTERSIHEAHRLWNEVDRPNVMVKIPGTPEGIPAIRSCLADGLNINITLMFSMEHYMAVVEAFMQGLEERTARGDDIDHIASVASFFVSRVDTLCDKKLSELIAAAGDDAERRHLEALKGRIGVANSKAVYERFRELFATPRWERLAAAGARLQRVLWASTGTKDPAYSDVLYVEELIGPDTVNTLPQQTLEAFLDHGSVQRTVDAGMDRAHADLAALANAGIDLRHVGEELQRDGVRLFAEAFDGAVGSVEEKRASFAGTVS